jgi:hypothetical protein
MMFGGLALARFRLIVTLEELLSGSKQFFTFGRCFWTTLMAVRGILDWKFFAGSCKPSERTEGGQERIGEYFDGWMEQIFLSRFLNGPS